MTTQQTETIMKALSRKQAQEQVSLLGNFKVKAMSGGYVALWHGKEQLGAWLTPEQAVEMARGFTPTVQP